MPESGTLCLVVGRLEAQRSVVISDLFYCLRLLRDCVPRTVEFEEKHRRFRLIEILFETIQCPHRASVEQLHASHWNPDLQDLNGGSDGFAHRTELAHGCRDPLGDPKNAQ